LVLLGYEHLEQMSLAASSQELARHWVLCGSGQSCRFMSSSEALLALVSLQPCLVPSSAWAALCRPGETVSFSQEEAFPVQWGVKLLHK